MRVSPEIMDGAFRISLSRETTREELDALVQIIEGQILPRVR